MPYYDEGIPNEDGIAGRKGHNFPISEWKEEYDAKDLAHATRTVDTARVGVGHCDVGTKTPDCAGDKGGAERDGGSASGGGTVEVKGEWAYVPIITNNEGREMRGKKVNVYKGESDQIAASQHPLPPFLSHFAFCNTARFRRWSGLVLPSFGKSTNTSSFAACRRAASSTHTDVVCVCILPVVYAGFSLPLMVRQLGAITQDDDAFEED